MTTREVGDKARWQFNVTAGTRYEVRVGGFRSTQSVGDGSEGNIVLNGAFVSGVMLGDVNQTGEVSFSDISAFIMVLASGGLQAEADIDENGVVDFEDIGPFITILSSL